MAEQYMRGTSCFGQIPTSKLEHYRRGHQLCRGCDRSRKLPTTLTKSGKLPSVPPICETCRKFYYRHLKTGEILSCKCNSPLATVADKIDCRRCRFDRCKTAMKGSSSPKNNKQISLDSSRSSESGPKESPPLAQSSRLDFSKIPCKVCGCSSSGVHFGVISCEGCKSFFRRSMRGTFRNQYRCKQHDKKAPAELEPEIMCPQTSNCRQCRLKRCFDVGMSQAELAIGRLNREQRRELDDAIDKLAEQQAALREPVLRRQRRTIEKVDCTNQAEEEERRSSSSSSGNSSVGEGDGCSSSTSYSGGYKAESEIATFSSTRQLILAGPSSSSGNSSDEDQQRIMIMDFMLQTDPLIDVLDMETVNDFSFFGYDSIPQEMPYPDISSSLEMTLAPSPQSWDILGCNDLETSFWLIEKATEATARLTPISQLKVIATSEMSKEDYLKARASSFDVYIRAISDFVTNLPGINQVSIQDRVTMFTNGFFPILMAQFSLEFDAIKRITNHFSLGRGLAYQISEGCDEWHYVTERYLVEAGSEFQCRVFNLKEYALLCALLCFNPDIPSIGDPHRLNAMKRRYELALYHYLTHSGSYSPERIEEYKKLLGFFQSSTNVFKCEIKLLPTRCEIFFNLSSPLYKDFRMQFLALTPPHPSPGYITYR